MHATTRRDWRLLATIATVAVAARLIAFGNPVIHVDEEFYFVVARAMWNGATPFVDIWDRKPIGLFLIYLPAAALPLPLATYVYQGLALASVIATAWLIARLAERAGWNRGALAAAIAYILWLNLLGGVGGQAPVFFNLPMAAAAALIASGDGRRRHGLAAMALVGLSLQVKYSVVFEGMFFGLWLLAAEWRTRRSVVTLLGYGAALIIVALAPTLAAYMTYAANGEGAAFVFANFTSILARNPDPPAERLGNAATLALILSPLIGMAIAGRGYVAGSGEARVRVFARLWLVAAMAAVALFGSYFDHYGLPVLVPGCICASAFLAAFARRTAVWTMLGLVAAVGLATILSNRSNRGTASQFADLVEAVGSGPGCLYVYSGTTMLYPATGRCRVSRYVFPSHLARARERGATGVDQEAEVSRILAQGPAVIVMRPPYRGERGEIRARVLAAVAQSYGLVAAKPMGRETISVFARVTPTSPAAPPPPPPSTR